MAQATKSSLVHQESEAEESQGYKDSETSAARLTSHRYDLNIAAEVAEAADFVQATEKSLQGIDDAPAGELQDRASASTCDLSHQELATMISKLATLGITPDARSVAAMLDFVSADVLKAEGMPPPVPAYKMPVLEAADAQTLPPLGGGYQSKQQLQLPLRVDDSPPLTSPLPPLPQSSSHSLPPSCGDARCTDLDRQRHSCGRGILGCSPDAFAVGTVALPLKLPLPPQDWAAGGVATTRRLGSAL